MAYIWFVSILEVFPRVKLSIQHFRLAIFALDPPDPGNTDPTGFSVSRTYIKQKMHKCTSVEGFKSIWLSYKALAKKLKD